MFEIKKHNEPILRKRAKEVAEVDDEVRKLIAFMVQAMYQNNGAGLAANQVGLDMRIAVVDAGQSLKILVNPKIVKTEGEIIEEEGCLSVPGLFLKIKRPKLIEVEALDKYGRPIKITAQGLEARAICQELDHLDGKLIVDYMGFWQKLRYKLGI